MKRLQTVILLLRALIAILLLALTAPWEAWGATYYVAPTGNDTTGTGMEAAPWLTLHHALVDNKIAWGDTVYLRTGIYDELNSNPSVATGNGEPITIMAYPGDQVTINIAAGSANFLFFCKNPGGLIFRDINFTDTNNKGLDFVRIDGAGGNLSISNCTLDHGTSGYFIRFNTGAGIQRASLSRCTLRGSTSVAIKSQDVAGSVPSVTVESTLVYGTGGFVQADGGMDIALTNNSVVKQGGVVVSLASASTIELKNNYIEAQDGTTVAGILLLDPAALYARTNPASWDVEHNVFYRRNAIGALKFEYTRSLILFTSYWPYYSISNRFVQADFTNYAADDFTLVTGSTLNGWGSTADLPTLDRNGMPWSGGDMGCFKNPAADKTLPTLTPQLVAFDGDSIMEGTGASDDAHKCYRQFAALSGLTVALPPDTAIGGSGARSLIWIVDQTAFVSRAQTVFLAIGVNDYTEGDPIVPNMTLDQFVETVRIIMAKLASYGARPIWLGMLADGTVNPTESAAVNSSVETMCDANGWEYGNLLNQMLIKFDWGTHYYTDVTSDLHPDDDGHLLIAVTAYNLLRSNILQNVMRPITLNPMAGRRN